MSNHADSYSHETAHLAAQGLKIREPEVIELGESHQRLWEELQIAWREHDHELQAKVRLQEAINDLVLATMRGDPEAAPIEDEEPADE